MLLTVILIFAISYLIHNSYIKQRNILCLIAIIIYTTYSIIDFIWLVEITDWPFHPSDPSAYFSEVKELSFSSILKIESSNTFYYIVNWIYWKEFEDPFICSVFLRIDNILAYITAYLLLTYKSNRFNYLDWIILFNPFAIITIVRNVRDIYIILFVLISMIGLGLFPKYRKNIYYAIGGIFLLSITRSVLLFPIFLVYYVANRNKLSSHTQYFIIISLIGGLIAFFPLIFQKIARQMISALDYVGEDIQTYLPLLSGQISPAIIKALFIRLFIGGVSMMFTPHPLKFYNNWMSSSEWDNIVGIYTFPDNCLIYLGSIFNYLFVIPLFIYLSLNYKQVNRNLFLFSLCFIILYVISYLGIVDIRNRNTAIFFILASLYYSSVKINITIKHYVATLVIFGVLYLV